jgi:tRNA 2-thiocytidine biosynthesis protein TtcA
MSRLNKQRGLIEPGDRVMVAISGGKDSWGMLHLLRAYQRKLPFDFSMVAVNLDQGHPGFPVSTIRDHLVQEGFEHHLVSVDTFRVVKEHTPQGKAFCSLCSRLRRGILYRTATELGATKIALGHHREDVLETFLLNFIYAGQLKAMPCSLRSDSGEHTVIRPLATCAEADLAALASARGYPIVPCDLCGSQENLRRKKMKALISEFELEDSRIPSNMFAALGNIKPSHLWDEGLANGASRGEASDIEPGTEGASGATTRDGLVRLRATSTEGESW